MTSAPRVSNTFADQATISVNVYGANIRALRRSVKPDGKRKLLMSGFSNTELPNFCDCSKNP